MSNLIIIGTIHQSTKNYPAVDLFNAIEKIRPDVIFEELPTELHVEPIDKIIPFGEELEGQEGSAIKWYFDKYKIPVIPIDLPNRNELYKKNISQEGLIANFKILKESAKDFHKIEEYFEITERQKELSLIGNITDINSEKMDTLVLRKRELINEFCIPFLDKNLQNQNYIKKYEDWFDERESYMANTVKKQMKNFEKAVFPVGAEHRVTLLYRLGDLATLY